METYTKMYSFRFFVSFWRLLVDDLMILDTQGIHTALYDTPLRETIVQETGYNGFYSSWWIFLNLSFSATLVLSFLPNCEKWLSSCIFVDSLFLHAVHCNALLEDPETSIFSSFIGVLLNLWELCSGQCMTYCKVWHSMNWNLFTIIWLNNVYLLKN